MPPCAPPESNALVLAKHTGSVNLADLVTDGIDQIQQQFDPLCK